MNKVEARAKELVEKAGYAEDKAFEKAQIEEAKYREAMELKESGKPTAKLWKTRFRLSPEEENEIVAGGLDYPLSRNQIYGVAMRISTGSNYTGHYFALCDIFFNAAGMLDVWKATDKCHHLAEAFQQVYDVFGLEDLRVPR